jgi:hypothetical protein
VRAKALAACSHHCGAGTWGTVNTGAWDRLLALHPHHCSIR